MSETRLREEIVRFARSLFERGLTPGSSGNISLRLEDGGWLVTPTNASLGFLDPARLSRLDGKGRLLSGDKPTKEIPLHRRSMTRAAGWVRSSICIRPMRWLFPCCRRSTPPMSCRR